MNPEDLKYTAEHEWVRVDGAEPGTVRDGITDYAQEALGDYPGALESLGRIYTVDVMFKDVQQKMERVRKLAKRPSERPSAAGGS